MKKQIARVNLDINSPFTKSPRVTPGAFCISISNKGSRHQSLFSFHLKGKNKKYQKMINLSAEKLIKHLG